MMPVVSHTQITVPTQVSFVATPLPGTQALHVLPDAVAPAVSDAALANDYKGNGGYAGVASTPSAPSLLSSPVLSALVPNYFSTASATLSPGAMFAAQLFSQDAKGGSEFFAVYENLVAAAQVKYKPSNASLPEPAPNNLFARMLAETQNQNARVAAQIQQPPKDAPVQAAVPQVVAAAKGVAETKQKPTPALSHAVATARYAAAVAHSASARSGKPVEEVQAAEDANG